MTNQRVHTLVGRLRQLSKIEVALSGKPWTLGDEAADEIERLSRLLNPRLWTPEQDAAWHKAIPDLYKAFEVLRGASEPKPPQS